MSGSIAAKKNSAQIRLKREIFGAYRQVRKCRRQMFVGSISTTRRLCPTFNWFNFVCSVPCPVFPVTWKTNYPSQTLPPPTKHHQRKNVLSENDADTQKSRISTLNGAMEPRRIREGLITNSRIFNIVQQLQPDASEHTWLGIVMRCDAARSRELIVSPAWNMRICGGACMLIACSRQNH